MPDIEYEYSRSLPPEADGLRFTDGEPILYAYECVLPERETADRFIYTAVSLNTGGKVVLARRVSPLTTSEVEKTVERMRLSKIAGARSKAEYIPRLSQMLLDGGIIKEPLSAVLRKGKEHYLCKRNLQTHLQFESNPATRRVLEGLPLPGSAIDNVRAKRFHKALQEIYSSLPNRIFKK
ncbi:MAG: hypothetical protein LBC56_04630 [Oscillospiraceae bacterium]|jgi:hypothetical protein|nr:hypothetical protein [Oscillospiraceae bacterium]